MCCCSSHPTPALVLKDVCLRYKADQPWVLSRLSLTLFAGQRVCIVGANGSGKSSLARILAGLLAPDSGSVTINGITVCTNGQVDKAAYAQARRSVGMVFQNPNDQLVTSIVADDIAFGPENLGLDPDTIEQRVSQELHRVGMQAYAQAHPNQLSGGQQQRVAIAAALAMRPRILLLDEPSSALDVRGRDALLAVLDNLHDTTIVHVTHAMDEVLQADRVIVLDHGSIVLDDTPDEVFSHASILHKLGLELPLAAQLSHRLQDAGFALTSCNSLSALAEQLHPVDTPLGAMPPHTTPPDRTAASDRDAHAMPHNDTSGIALPSCTKNTVSEEGVPADILAAQHLGFSYSSAPTLVDVSLAIKSASHTVLVGPTGSGKTTLSRILAGLQPADTGTLQLMRSSAISKLSAANTAGLTPTWPTAATTQDISQELIGREDLQHYRGSWLARRALVKEQQQIRLQWNQRVGFLMQRAERQLFAETVLDDVMFGPLNCGSADPRGDALAALTLVGLADRADDSPFALSGGQQRLCALAGVLAMNPQVLVLDEPMAGLDPQACKRLAALIDAIRSTGVAIVEITHAMERAACASYIYVVAHGSICLKGRPCEVFSAAHRTQLIELGLGLPQTAELAWHIMPQNTYSLPLTQEAFIAWAREHLPHNAGSLRGDTDD